VRNGPRHSHLAAVALITPAKSQVQQNRRCARKGRENSWFSQFIASDHSGSGVSGWA